MAEAALFSLAGKLLVAIASPTVNKAYERASSIWAAKNELEELAVTIRTIQAMLLDAEMQQHGSATVRDLMERIRDVLYAADDLFDEAATQYLLSRQVKGKKHLKEVQVFFSKLNPVVFRDSIAKEVKAIRKSLLQISSDMSVYNFVRLEHEDRSGLRRGVETWSFVDKKLVYGRDDEKAEILEFLYDESCSDQNISVIAIIGIGGMGKSTLAQLVYNDENVLDCFNEKRRWWACISDTLDEKEVIGKIYSSLTGKPYQNLDLNMLQSEIRARLDGKFLLVLDDLWDEDRARGQRMLSLLTSDSIKGSKIIVTTRSSSVAKAMDAKKMINLNNLSNDASWELFKRFAFTHQHQENDQEWNSLGRKIVDRCANVPLAIKSIACLLSTRDTIEEWRSFVNVDLPRIEVGENSIMSSLRLSYNHLPSNLKHCFAYCSLFPKDTILYKNNLIDLWVAQGFVEIGSHGTLEAAGHAHFMDLLRRSFFQEAEEVDAGSAFMCTITGDIHCKMHDLIHDLAQNVAGKESIIIPGGSNQFDRKIRHLALGNGIDNSWNIPAPLLEANRLRSFLGGGSCGSHVIDQQVSKLKFLRALDLQELGIENVPSSIGELKHLRYLNLSRNHFKCLPDSITKLVNLVTLDINYCARLIEFPEDFRALINLKHLNNGRCDDLLHMPTGFGEMTSLERLGEFKVSKRCGLGALAGLNLQGDLVIRYERNDDWDGSNILECSQIPEAIRVLTIQSCPNTTIPVWWREDQLYKLKYLSLKFVVAEHLPPFRRLPCLRHLQLNNLYRLEYVEEYYEAVSTSPFFPSLHRLELIGLPRLKGWSRGLAVAVADMEEHPSFPLLSNIFVADCYGLNFIPPTPHLQTLDLMRVTKEVVETLLSASSLLTSTSTSNPSSPLIELSINSVQHPFRPFASQHVTTYLDLTRLSIGGLTSLQKLRISNCKYLKNVQLASKALKELFISNCPEFDLWNTKEEGGVDWSSLENLSLLSHDKIPEAEKLPECVRQCIALGKLLIK